MSGTPEIVSLPPHETTQYRPKQNSEYRVRIFVKDSSKQELAKDAYLKYKKSHGALFNVVSTLRVSPLRLDMQSHSVDNVVAQKT